MRTPSIDRLRQQGVTSIEYALISALVAMVVLVAITNLGTKVGELYTFVADKVSCAVSGKGGC